MVVTPNVDFVKRGVLLGFVTKLGNGLGGILVGSNLSQKLTILVATIGVVGKPQIIFTNLISTTHVNKITDRPLVSSMVIGGYKNANIVNLRRGYWEPSAVIAQFFYHKNGHYVKPNMVALKYPNLKKDVDLDVHVRVFNSIVKVNVKTFEKYIVNAFSYMLKNLALD